MMKTYMIRGQRSYAALVVVLLIISTSACGQSYDLEWPGTVMVPLPRTGTLQQPDWSPNGGFIAVASTNFRGQGDFFIANVEDKTYVTLGQQTYYRVPHWSNDGSRLVTTVSGSLSVLSFPELQAGLRLAGEEADWGPDDEHFVAYLDGIFTHDRPARVWTADVHGNMEDILFEMYPKGPDDFGGLAWSTATNQIAFSYGSEISGTTQTFHRDIYLADPETGVTTLFLDSSADEFSPSWSPDGNWLVYVAADGYPNQPGTVTFAKSDGSCTIPALSGPWLTGVAWSPEGSMLAVTNADRLYLVDIVKAFGAPFADLDKLCGGRQDN